MLKNKLTVFLKFASVEKIYECTVSESCSFHQILETIKPMIASDMDGEFSLEQKMDVISRYDNRICDQDVSLRSLGIRSGMEFLIV